jgi:hypothetical protein
MMFTSSVVIATAAIHIFSILRTCNSLSVYLFALTRLVSVEFTKRVDIHRRQMRTPIGRAHFVTQHHHGRLGRPVPDLDWTIAVSVLLMSPLALTSVRKLELVTGLPD